MSEIKDIRALLAENPFFNGMADAHLDMLAGCGKLARIEAGKFLLREGEVADTFYLIRQGEVAVESHIPAVGALSVTRVSAGGIIGYSWLFPPYRWSFEARAVQDVHAIKLDGACLREKCEIDPRMGYDLMKRFSRIMTRRLEATRLQLLDLYGKVNHS